VGGDCRSPPGPAPSVCTLSASCAAVAVSASAPGLFHPGSAPELSPSRRCVVQRSGPVSGTAPPLPFARFASAFAVGFGGLHPPCNGRLPRAWVGLLALLAFHPSEALPSAAAGSGFPAPSSHVLRRAGRARRRAPQSVRDRRTGCAPRLAPRRYRPLWGSSPRRARGRRSLARVGDRLGDLPEPNKRWVRSTPGAGCRPPGRQRESAPTSPLRAPPLRRSELASIAQRRVGRGPRGVPGLSESRGRE